VALFYNIIVLRAHRAVSIAVCVTVWGGEDCEREEDGLTATLLTGRRAIVRTLYNNDNNIMYIYTNKHYYYYYYDYYVVMRIVAVEDLTRQNYCSIKKPYSYYLYLYHSNIVYAVLGVPTSNYVTYRTWNHKYEIILDINFVVITGFVKHNLLIVFKTVCSII